MEADDEEEVEGADEDEEEQVPEGKAQYCKQYVHPF